MVMEKNKQTEWNETERHLPEMNCFKWMPWQFAVFKSIHASIIILHLFISFTRYFFADSANKKVQVAPLQLANCRVFNLSKTTNPLFVSKWFLWRHPGVLLWLWSCYSNWWRLYYLSRSDSGVKFHCLYLTHIWPETFPTELSNLLTEALFIFDCGLLLKQVHSWQLHKQVSHSGNCLGIKRISLFGCCRNIHTARLNAWLWCFSRIWLFLRNYEVFSFIINMQIESGIDPVFQLSSSQQKCISQMSNYSSRLVS